MFKNSVDYAQVAIYKYKPEGLLYDAYNSITSFNYNFLGFKLNNDPRILRELILLAILFYRQTTIIDTGNELMGNCGTNK